MQRYRAAENAPLPSREDLGSGSEAGHSVKLVVNVHVANSNWYPNFTCGSSKLGYPRGHTPGNRHSRRAEPGEGLTFCVYLHTQKESGLGNEAAHTWDDGFPRQLSVTTVRAGQFSDAEVGAAVGDIVYAYYVHDLAAKYKHQDFTQQGLNGSHLTYVAAPSQLHLLQIDVDAEDSGPLQDFRVRDHVLPSQLQYSVEAAEMEVIQLPGLA
ncbi:unnamed protein product [Schistocephalus solidus]|uniref:Histone-arginine methyltransferase CARM1 n=1 Tax=Schistocephalus solidus TaxID=70667 RepID=A0A183SPM4_SCHSO|nr:unnamed protein product [Schistocephalus solidus]